MFNSKPKIVLSITDAFCLGFLRGQAKYLNENGFEVYLFCPEGDGLDAYGENEGCKIIKIPYRREISPLADLKALYLTWKHFIEIKPDIINVGTPKSGLLGVVAGAFSGVKHRIFTLRGLRSTAEPEGFQKKIVEFMEKVTHKFATNVISITPSMANYAWNHNILSKDKTVVLAKASSNGINTERFNPSKKNSKEVIKLRMEFGLSENDFVIGFVGRVVKSKGVEEIYKAFKNISVKYNNVKLLIIGPIEITSDSVSSDILKQMEDDKKVILTGNRKDVEYCYHLMNVFTLPSHNFREGFGNVAMEASSSGLPIIVTRGAGCQDAVIDKVTGLLIDPINFEQLNEAFEFYYNNPEFGVEHGIEGVKYANEYFRNEVIWKAQVDFYKSLLS